MKRTYTTEPNIGQRIVVVGTTCAGKTTMAHNLSQRLGIPHVEMDALHWGPNWTLPTVEAFRESISAALTGNAWAADGNYSKVRDIVWSRADTVVWLDYPFPIIFARLLKRTFSRVITQEELWNGNRESWRGMLLSRDSLILWAIKTHGKRRKKFLHAFADPTYAHLAVIRLHTPRKAQRWLENLPTRHTPRSFDSGPPTARASAQDDASR